MKLDTRPPAPALTELKVSAPTLVGFGYLEPLSLVSGPPSGNFLERGPASNNHQVPFPGQVFQGISAFVKGRDGEFVALLDNGFAYKRNSPDALLGIVRINVDFRTPGGGTGEVRAQQFVYLSDPYELAGQPIIAEQSHYPADTTNGFPGTPSSIPVAEEIREKRLLTGADFDPESFRIAPDGTFWVADEFGPFLLHFSEAGELLEAPISIPIPKGFREFSRGLDVFVSPDHPSLAIGSDDSARTAAANVRRSKGVEGMAMSPDGSRLYLLLEGPLVEDPNQRRLLIREFDLGTTTFTEKTWFYELEREYKPGSLINPQNTKIGCFSALSDHEFLVLETDDGQGDSAWCKKLFRIDLRENDGTTALTKTEHVDLLTLANPDNLAAPWDGDWFRGSESFGLPHLCLESVLVLDSNTLIVVNDNNFPMRWGNGRSQTRSDGTEFVMIRLPR
jgi:hypothetical protein